MNSKNKGNRWERAVAAWLTEWTGFKFERNRAGSGSWWSNNDAGADITCTDERHAHRCKLSVECKCYRDIRFEHVLLGNKGCDIIKFWEQASLDAKRTGKIPILCMRYNSMAKGQFFFVIDKSMIKPFTGLVLNCTSFNLIIPEKGYNLMVFMSNDVISNVDYNEVHKEAKLLLKS